MAQCIGLFLLTLWQMQGKAVSYGIFRNTQTICNVLFTLLLVIVLNYGWQGRLGAQIFTAAIFSVVALGLLYKHGFLKISFNSEYVKDALSFGIPLIPHALGAFVISMIDRLFITKMVGIADTGIYSVGYQIGMIIGLIENSFNQAWVPWLYSKLAAGGTDVKIKIVRITYCYNLFILLLALGLGWLGPWAIKFFVGREFAGSGIYVVWIAPGYAFNGMYKMVCNYIFFIGKTYILAWVTFFSAVANIGLNYVLVSAYGAIGAAQASTLTFFVSFVLTWMLSARVYPMPWGDFRTLFSKNGSDNLKDRDSN
jgi:O-antigen/teichoic acid export membrane protein